MRLIFKLGISFLLFPLAAQAEPLFVPEPLLEKALAKALRVDQDSLTSELLAEKLEYFELSNAQIRDLTGLQAAKKLKVLVLRDNLIEDLTPIMDLPHLRKLDLSGNKIADLSPFVGLSIRTMQDEITEIQLKLSNHKTPKSEVASLILSLSELVERLKRGPWQLQELSLSNNRLLGLSGISHLSQLRHLDVSGNSLIDLEGVGKLHNIVTLYLQGNQLGRVESYVDENKNKTYDLGEKITDESGNGKRDTDPLVELQSLTNLVNLYLYDNLIKGVDSLKDLPRLQTLLLSGNQLQSIKNLGSFKELRRLSLSDNRINSLAGLESLPKIEHLYLVENRICDLRSIQGLTSLKELRLQRNQFFSLDALSGLERIEVLSLSNNFIYSLKPLVKLKGLKRLSLSGNCLDLQNQSLQDQIKQIRSRGVFLITGNQKKRVIAAEQLIFSMIGHPSSNSLLGDYLEGNGYMRLMDFAEDTSIDDTTKSIEYKRWQKGLMNGTFQRTMPFLGN
ncbi:MAG: leucine-rich repeat domain-containing protein [Opitutales bacterium]|nr:leucine-rich repeat domain-containing protein [Opitutales bacterium]